MIHTYITLTHTYPTPYPCVHAVSIQLPVNRVSPVPDADSDSDDEWNMLGRRVTSKDQHSPHKDEPAKVQPRQYCRVKMGWLFVCVLCRIL